MGFKELYDQLLMLDEHERIEAKTSSNMGRSLLETICAYSNEPKLGGGHILLGVSPEQNAFLPTYEIVGISSNTYYKPSEKILSSPPTRMPLSEGVKPLSEGVRPLSEGVRPLSEGVTSLSGGGERLGDETIQERLQRLPLGLKRPPADLILSIKALGQRGKPEEVRTIILQLCAWRPLKSKDIAILLNRTPTYLVEKYLSPMIDDGLLEYTIPEVPFHANQAYRTKSTDQTENKSE